ncbi:glutamate-ammonia-ligase adenylyltransferase [Aliidongia dinghuensis]|uniref:Bifunctional glutamine synthetase adenylyltransferase/adenylyl-removing enzyme n=1 Tax=Aliidongia dinghuensis TaxID=1867774 RepID=A0A8J3E3N6_9PROT|nr:bifunctional [glutamine synthetase] adenylyltransferase/[glutamine synthetase]-adenylyl-L-tyrosine phosphorylase [Aliidongia dinghuensis]GGF31979.1 glutamate-ammonia-ligase adenylyltransferase [Aliidongia dinghuensis]
MTEPLISAERVQRTRLPVPADAGQAAIEWERWTAAAEAATAESETGEPLGRGMAAVAADPTTHAWLDAVFGNSPYLTRLALREPEVALAAMTTGIEPALARVLEEVAALTGHEPRAEIMTRLRAAKRRAALVIALADIAELWPLERVTGALSALADAALGAAVRHLLVGAHTSGQLALPHPDEPERDSGVIVLGMGKLGAHELNYSSDIDLIILYDADRMDYRGRDAIQPLMARLARDLVKLLEERTVDGYVFRTDLRLRPDPASTPPAVSVAAAETYYGSLGQNWERAAMIKARPVAGDIPAGQAFLKTLGPFIWRKHLDFAAIRDIHSIKRQIDARHGAPAAGLAGHNIKLGHGGIREIEFFAQTQQLIWGGRVPTLRSPGTIETLEGLVATGRLADPIADDLAHAYRVLRRVEHRLQMIDDAQTHSLPTDPQALGRLAIFLGFPDAASFAADLGRELAVVRRHFAELFRGAPALSAEGNLVFTGKELDPDTLATLRAMGFKSPEPVADAIRGWHHGRIRATRSARARELLTELTPALLRVLGKTADPDFAFIRFDEFLSRLPAGVQMFSLFQHHPDLLQLVAEIMGESPQLAVQLARRPLLLDGVISGAFFIPLPTEERALHRALTRDLSLAVARARDYEDLLDLTRRWANDRKFQIGVQLLQGRIEGWRSAKHFSAVADIVIQTLLPRVEEEFARQHGHVPGGRFLVLGLGKLGSSELNQLSDLDLIFLYSVPDGIENSDGAKPLAYTTYYARLGQRLINALQAPTGEGNLYEVDMRLRPSGNAGPIASKLDGFLRYHEEQAWTWEHMALTRARAVAGDASLARETEATIRTLLTKPRDADRLLIDVDDMRIRIEKAHLKPTPWDAKHRRGGLVDLEFIAQYLQLRVAPEDPSVLATATNAAFRRLITAHRIDPEVGAELLEGLAFWHQVQGMLRVAVGKDAEQSATADLLARALTRATGTKDPALAYARLDEVAARGLALYERLVARPAKRARRAHPELQPPDRQSPGQQSTETKGP